jgi:hypothetical protein
MRVSAGQLCYCCCEAFGCQMIDRTRRIQRRELENRSAAEFLLLGQIITNFWWSLAALFF